MPLSHQSNHWKRDSLQSRFVVTRAEIRPSRSHIKQIKAEARRPVGVIKKRRCYVRMLEGQMEICTQPTSTARPKDKVMNHPPGCSIMFRSGFFKRLLFFQSPQQTDCARE